MNHHYADIRDRIDADPLWWDENAVPRYCPPSPQEVANIYAREVAFVDIACQACGSRFLAAFSSAPLFGEALSGRLVTHGLHYGDPPNVGCCPAGATMNSIPHRVVEFWRRGGSRDWERVPALERAMDHNWASEEAGDE